jgi:hypothetical protein
MSGHSAARRADPLSGSRAIARRGMSVAVDAAGRLYQLRSERRAAARIDRIGARDGPIVVGPWVSELGFELLYWVPLLRRALARRAIAPERVTVLTRGGAHCWYRDFAAGHVELFDLLPPAEFRELNDQRTSAVGGQKQLALAEMEAEILRRAGDALDPAAELVHPSLLYQAFRYYWAGRSTPEAVTRCLRFAQLAPARHSAVDALPERYVAVKAYHSASFPDTAQNRRFVAELVRRLSARTAVVLLAAVLSIDDHEDVAVGAEHDVIVAGDLFGAHDNIQAQTAIVAGADALFSSYGGFSYLGPFVGVPSISFSSVDRYNSLHLEIARRAVHQLGVGPFVVSDTSDVRALDDLLGAAVPRMAP